MKGNILRPTDTQLPWLTSPSLHVFSYSLPSALQITGNPSTADAISGWRSDLDWAALSSKLSSSASLIDTSYDDYAGECGPEFYQPNPTNHALIDQPSG
eukprot:scaffold19559_cov73-Skeletonema_marinoi.AAC.1